MVTSRKKTVKRTTGETTVTVSINLDGSGRVSASTGISFIDHMIIAFTKHAMMDLKINAVSKDNIEHHLVEDVAITIGSAIDKALDKRSGITRFGHASIPMDEALAEASVDLVRRQFSVISLSLKRSNIEKVSKEDLEHFFQSLLINMNSCIHVTVKDGKNDHHKVESAIKSLAVALRQAMSFDSKQKGIPSTKGKMVD
ncbi:MAG: imidazoleglycerol-phosphate dehydratase [Cenarchaeum symbiont of Oopsacas minuta]|nr:imidazoleglycerol-phosphate dehydratase [Cenarchaeum symbiont of Oopsacas minuta]